MATTVTLKPNAIDISGATSGTTTLQATAVAGTTTLTLPAATDTLVGKATTDTLTNKTLTGAVMNGTLGATTPSTVAATSITASTTLGVTGVATFSAGTAALPAITTTGDTNTGIFFPAADTIAFTEGGVESMRIDSSGNVGIGTASPYTKLDVTQATGGFGGWKYVLGANATDFPAIRFLATTGNTGNIIAHEAGSLVFLNGTTATTAGAEKMRLDSSGNLAIGVTTASTLLTLQTSSGEMFRAIVSSNTGLYTSIGADGNGGWVNGSTNLMFRTGGTERARIDSGGDLLVGTTSVGIGTTRFASYNNSGSGFAGVFANQSGSPAATTVLKIYHGAASGATAATQMEFLNGSATTVGSITSTGSVTAYVTTSDYRLKNNQAPLTKSGEFIDALKPKTWDWAVDGSKGAGFIAHEFAEVSPISVNGEKDAVDENGKPVYQSMQASSSEVIANLVAEIQSLRKRLATAGI